MASGFSSISCSYSKSCTRPSSSIRSPPASSGLLTREFGDNIRFELCQETGNSETADALRRVADKNEREFIVLAGDLVTDVVLHDVADCHRMNDASMTMLLRQEIPLRRATGEKPRRGKDMTDSIALVEGQHYEENRVMLVPQAMHHERRLVRGQASAPASLQLCSAHQIVRRTL